MPMTSLIRQIFPRRGVPDPLNKDIHYGIELEYERMRTAWDEANWPVGWEVHQDGSLRNNGIELVSTPLSRNDLGPALERIEEYLGRHRPLAHPRCGLHLHINMRPFTVSNLYCFAALYALAEPSIFASWCPERLSSSFCVPLFYNTHMQNALAESNYRARHGVNRCLDPAASTSKYSAINFMSLSRFNTVEMRQLPATLNFQRIRRWIDLYTRLYDLSLTFTDPVDVVDTYEGLGLEAFQETVLHHTQAVDERQQALAVAAATLISGNRGVL